MSLANTQIYESTNYYVSKPNSVFMYDSWTTPSFVSTGSESFYVILLTSVNSASNLWMHSRGGPEGENCIYLELDVKPPRFC